jgi:CubicO group peptidase (beta-lactamase class C family)
MKRLSWILCLIPFCFGLPASADTSAGADGTVQTRVDAVFADLDSTHSPGCAAAIFQDGEILYANGYGMANLEHGIPITPKTVFDIGSTSKQFTAAAIALLALDGKLSLDDDIREYIPELPMYDRTITVRHLLHHTSGVRDYGALLALSGTDDHNFFTYEELVDLTARQKNLNFLPGDDHLYSNTGYILLAVVVERVAGVTFGEFVTERIFEPLGMDSTLIYEDRDRLVPNRATGYSWGDDGEPRIDHYWNFALAGDGQVLTTVEDLLQWDTNFYDPKVGGEEFLAMMLTRGVLTNGEEIPYALGLYHGDYRGVKTVHHGGAWGGFRAQFVRVPEHRLSAVVLCNLGSSGPDDRAHQILDIVLEESLEPLEDDAAAAETVVLDPGTLDGLDGDYQLEIGVMFKVTIEGDKLFMEGAGMPPMELVPISETEFMFAELGAKITFERDPAGRASKITAHVGSDAMEGIRIDGYEPTAAEFAGYAGSYYSDELDTVWRLVAEDGTLSFWVGFGPGHPIQFTGKDTFASDRFTGTFERGPDGEVTAVVIDAFRTKNLRAVKTD